MSIIFHQNNTPSVLSFFPNTRGVGYSFFQSNKEHHHSKMICARTRDNRTYLKRVKAVIDQYQPKLIVLEYFKTHKDRHKTKRIRELIRSIAKYAQEQGIEIQYYSRAQVREVFSFYNAQKKYEIAELICTWIPELLLLMYPPREGERTEPHGSAVFSAVSLVLTHYYLNE